MAPRWRKVIADIVARPGRSVLAVLAMSIGVFALATLAFKQAILRPVLHTMYGATRPSSATLYVDVVDDALVESVRRLPGVGDAEARPIVLARVRVGVPGADEWMPAILYIVRDFDRQRMDLFTRDGGAWPPADDEVLLERSAVSVAKAARGDELAVRVPGGEEGRLRFAGTVHAAGLAPAWMEHVVYGFVPWTSSVRAGAHHESSQLRIAVADHALDEGHIREVTDDVRTFVESRGRRVTRVDVPTPGRHPHAAQMDTFLLLLGAFSVLAFLLSSVLVAGMIHALQAEQIKQVGILKALGATGHQITGIYLAQVGVLSAVSLLIGVPLGWLAGRGYANFSAAILNADVSHAPFPWGTLAGVLTAGALVPMLTALAPIVRASRITVREALADDLVTRPFGTRWLERATLRLSGSRPVLLPIRAALLHPGRLTLAISMLAIGGATFMAALNVSAGWTRAVTNDYARRHFDLVVRLASPQPVAALDAVFAATPSVARVEYWPGASPYLIGPSGVAGTTIALLGLAPTSRLLDLERTSGRWLDPDVPNGVVINNAVVGLHPGLHTGGTLQLRLEGRTLAYPIVGIVKELTPQPIVYAPIGVVRAATGQSADSARSARVVTQEHDDAAQRAAARELERRFAGAGIEVAGMHRTEDMKKGVLDHLVIIMVILTLAAGIVVLVGAIGLTSMLTINVLQRTREIGVLAAIGATPRTIAGLVWLEGVTIAAASAVVATLLALPVSALLESVTGKMFFRIPLGFTVSGGAIVVWFALVVSLASLASLYPAWRATRLTVREAIAHV